MDLGTNTNAYTVVEKTKKKLFLYKRFFKRPMDIILSLMALVFLSPIYLIVALLVRFKLGSSVIFKQERPGLNEKIFTMYKFRTMTDKRDENGELLSDEERLTDFGKWLRSTSLDELPELFNVLKGDMSLIGPRPQLIKDMLFMSGEQRKRHTVMPGLTGLAQINGRNNLNWEDKFKNDLEYIFNISFAEDFKIFFKTIIKVFKKDDVNTDGMCTSEDFGDYLLRIGTINYDEYEVALNKVEELLF